MSNQYKGKEGWMRILFTALFWVVFYFSQMVIFVIMVAQAAFVILTGERNHHLLVLGDRMASYVQHILRYITFNTDQRPFPFDDFPTSDLVVDHISQ